MKQNGLENTFQKNRMLREHCSVEQASEGTLFRETAACRNIFPSHSIEGILFRGTVLGEYPPED
jgi:hypothetical protein